MNSNQEKIGVYLDANVIIDCFLDDEYFQLLKKLKEKYNFSFLVSDFVIYEVLFTMLKYKVSEYLIREKKVPLTKIIQNWRNPQNLYKMVDEEVILKIGKENIDLLFNKIFKELGVLILTDFEKEDWKNMLDHLFPQFLYYGIHLEDAIHLTIAIYFGVDYFLTKDSGIYSNWKLLNEKYKIRILYGDKDAIKKYLSKKIEL